WVVEPVAVIVMGYVPNGVVLAVAIVSVMLSSLRIESAARVAVASGGAPDTARASVCGWPLTVAVASTVGAVSPGAVNPERGERSIANRSGPSGSPQIGWAIAQVAPSFDQVDCIANVPVANETFWAWPIPLASQAHLSAFSDPSESNHPPPGF